MYATAVRRITVPTLAAVALGVGVVVATPASAIGGKCTQSGDTVSCTYIYALEHGSPRNLPGHCSS